MVVDMKLYRIYNNNYSNYNIIPGMDRKNYDNYGVVDMKQSRKMNDGCGNCSSLVLGPAGYSHLRIITRG